MSGLSPPPCGLHLEKLTLAAVRGTISGIVRAAVTRILEHRPRPGPTRPQRAEPAGWPAAVVAPVGQVITEVARGYIGWHADSPST